MFPLNCWCGPAPYKENFFYWTLVIWYFNCSTLSLLLFTTETDTRCYHHHLPQLHLQNALSTLPLSLQIFLPHLSHSVYFQGSTLDWKYDLLLGNDHHNSNPIFCITSINFYCPDGLLSSLSALLTQIYLKLHHLEYSNANHISLFLEVNPTLAYIVYAVTVASCFSLFDHNFSSSSALHSMPLVWDPPTYFEEICSHFL